MSQSFSRLNLSLPFLRLKWFRDRNFEKFNAGMPYSRLMTFSVFCAWLVNCLKNVSTFCLQMLTLLRNTKHDLTIFYSQTVTSFLIAHLFNTAIQKIWLEIGKPAHCSPKFMVFDENDCTFGEVFF